MEHTNMNNEIYSDDMVLHVDDIDSDMSRHVIANDMGPAGLCSVPLVDGTVLHVDYAEPERLSSFEPGSDELVLSELVGAERAHLISSTDIETQGHPIRLPSGRTRRRFDVPSSRPRSNYATFELGMAASLDAIHRDGDELPLVRAIAGFEFAARVASSEVRSLIDGRAAKEMVKDSVDLALSDLNSVMALAGAERKRAHECADVVRQAHSAVGLIDEQDLASKFLQVTDLDDRRREGPDGLTEITQMIASAPMRPFPKAAPRRAAASLDTHFDAAHFVRLDTFIAAVPPDPSAEIRRLGRLKISWRREPIGTWARVVRHDSQVLLALAPIVQRGNKWVAEALIPPDLGVDELAIDAIDGLAGGDPTTRGEQVRAAVALGRLAVHATLMHQRDAQELWLRCADAWESLDDTRRADRARNYASGQIEVTRVNTLADRVRAVIDQP